MEEYEEIARTPAVTSEVRADPLAAAGVSKAEVEVSTFLVNLSVFPF